MRPFCVDRRWQTFSLPAWIASGAWDRYGSRYSWAIYVITFAVILPIYLVSSFVIVAFEESDRYVDAAAVTVVAVLVLQYTVSLPGLGGIRFAERWAAGHEVDRAQALDATYGWARRGVSERWWAPLFGPPLWRSLSVRSPGRVGRGGASTRSWAPQHELPSS
jgi:hypothetical protein